MKEIREKKGISVVVYVRRENGNVRKGDKNCCKQYIPTAESVRLKTMRYGSVLCVIQATSGRIDESADKEKLQIKYTYTITDFCKNMCMGRTSINGPVPYDYNPYYFSLIIVGIY